MESMHNNGDFSPQNHMVPRKMQDSTWASLASNTNISAEMVHADVHCYIMLHIQ